MARYDGFRDYWAFLDAGLRLERFEELENCPCPFAVALRWRR